MAKELLKGGQGRPPREVERSMDMLVISLGVCAIYALAALVIWLL